MDGNGRWAKAKGLPRHKGHEEGAKTTKKIVIHAAKSGVKYLTLYTFSNEYWNRPPKEVGFLMGLLKYYLVDQIDELHDAGVCLKVIGDKEKLAQDIQKLIEKIALYIKRRLTDADFELLDVISSEINHVSEKISEKLDSDVESLLTAEEPVPIPDEEPAEKKVSERMKNKLRKKIKEIVRTHMISGRYK
jgi:undecaprenyl diphosphate synthase